MHSYICLEVFPSATIQEDSTFGHLVEFLYHSDKVVIDVIFPHSGPQGMIPLLVEDIY